jgi:hypothetical protein
MARSNMDAAISRIAFQWRRIMKFRIFAAVAALLACCVFRSAALADVYGSGHFSFSCRGGFMRFPIATIVLGVLLSSICVRPAAADIYRTISGVVFVSCITSAISPIAGARIALGRTQRALLSERSSWEGAFE